MRAYDDQTKQYVTVVEHKYVSSGRNGYYAIDEYITLESGKTLCLRGCIVAFKSKKQSEEVESLLNSAYRMGRQDYEAQGE